MGRNARQNGSGLRRQAVESAGLNVEAFCLQPQARSLGVVPLRLIDERLHLTPTPKTAL